MIFRTEGNGAAQPSNDKKKGFISPVITPYRSLRSGSPRRSAAQRTGYLWGRRDANNRIPAALSLRPCCLGLDGLPDEDQHALEHGHRFGTA